MNTDNWAKWEEFKSHIREEAMDNKFKDISGHFAQKAITELNKMGVVNGVSDTEFAPDRPATRGEVSIIARNVIRYITGE